MFAIATLKHCFPDRKTVSILPGGHIIKKKAKKEQRIQEEKKSVLHYRKDIMEKTVMPN